MSGIGSKREMLGKTCLVTGATSGIGKAAATELARRGADVVIACRSQEKGERTAAEIERAAGRRPAAILTADFSSLTDVRCLAQAFLDSGRPLHVLVNNAGVVMQSRVQTVDGHEMMFCVNHLASFALTNLLRERLEQSAPARVVATASDAHRWERKRLDFDDLDARKKFGPMLTYGRSKLANILFTRELARRLDPAKVTAHCYHPGFVSSDLALNNGWVARTAFALARPFARSAEKGAETLVFLATAPEVAGESGGYFMDCRPHRPNFAAANDEDAHRLWDVSVRLVGAAS
jgi:retinol dehydrogenase-12